MMTGKAVRPLLALGLGGDSETWAGHLRRYGYKTAAFYPPAVFYIDEDRFTGFEERGLGFEYRWVEFTSAEAKVAKVDAYLATAPADPVFLWVHLFEPHEPYVAHPGFTFAEGSPLPVDAYDSEIAYVDAAVGKLLEVVHARRPGHGLAVIVTADHGEEFGEHGGRYHGTTCYEEQVRVPLLVSGPGVRPGRIPTDVQTIDLLPTVLSALGVPRPARLVGRDLGELLKGTVKPDPGFAYAETDDQTMVAEADDRLLCARKIGACALYDVARDPEERVDRSSEEPAKARELRGLLAKALREAGRYERADATWPDPIRRGLMREVDARVDVAALLDDASVAIRRKAAEVSYRLASLKGDDVSPELERALARDEDDEVRRWAALALVRGGAQNDRASSLASELLRSPDARWRRAAALAIGLHGDARAKKELADEWRDAGPPRGREGDRLDTEDAVVLLSALAATRDAEAVPSLLASLDYVPLRPRIAEALGAIADPRAKAPLLALFSHERYETARPSEARALVLLGAAREMFPALTLFAGLPDPMEDALAIAEGARLLEPCSGGEAFDKPPVDVDVTLSLPAETQTARLWVRDAKEGPPATGSVEATPLGDVQSRDRVERADVLLPPPATKEEGKRRRVRVRLHRDQGIEALWVVPVVLPPAFLEPKPPDAGAGDGAR
jgi:HEAT repeat protein